MTKFCTLCHWLTLWCLVQTLETAQEKKWSDSYVKEMQTYYFTTLEFTEPWPRDVFGPWRYSDLWKTKPHAANQQQTHGQYVLLMQWTTATTTTRIWSYESQPRAQNHQFIIWERTINVYFNIFENRFSQTANHCIEFACQWFPCCLHQTEYQISASLRPPEQIKRLPLTTLASRPPLCCSGAMA